MLLYKIVKSRSKTKPSINFNKLCSIYPGRIFVFVPRRARRLLGSHQATNCSTQVNDYFGIGASELVALFRVSTSPHPKDHIWYFRSCSNKPKSHFLATLLVMLLVYWTDCFLRALYLHQIWVFWRHTPGSIVPTLGLELRFYRSASTKSATLIPTKCSSSAITTWPARQCCG